MDINLKNSNENDNAIVIEKKNRMNFYSKKFKLLYVMIALISSSMLFLTVCFLNNHSDSYNNRDFDLEFARFCYNVVDAKLNLQSVQHIQDFYLESYEQSAHQNAEDIISTYVYRINSDGSSTQTDNNETILVTKENPTKSYSSTYTTDKIKQRIADFNKINNDLSNTLNFAYLIIDTQNNQIVDTNIDKNPNITRSFDQTTNAYIYTYTDTNGKNSTFNNPVDILKLQHHFISFIGGNGNKALYGNYESNIETLIKKTETSKYSIYCAVIEPILNSNQAADSFYSKYITHQKLVPIYKIAMATSLVLGFIFVSCLIVIALTTGQQEKHGEVTLCKIDTFYFDVHSVILLFIAFIALVSSDLTYEFVFIILFCVLIGINYFSSAFRQLKAKKLFRNTLNYHLLKWIKNFLMDLSVLMKAGQHYQLITFMSTVLILCLLNGLIYLYMLTSIYGNVFLAVIGIVLLDLLFVAWLIHLFVSLQMIKLATNKISSGHVDYVIPSEKLHTALKPLAQDIAHIQSGLSKAVDKAIKGERLKTELITNVSHDLKTPLTSIVNYVDLLKKEDLHNEKAVSYIAVLEEKSARLKQLIEDLVEASKASSGNLSVALEKVDLQQLVLQACGEYNERLNTLDVRINYSGNGILIAADGRHMWRIIDNLLSNISKYAQPNSRVYIDISQNAASGILTLKNISQNPLDISPNELTQRFVRGDTSRTTEGSGLGLSIAQSLTALQHGQFNIFIDGDLFKVVVEIPLWK